jgi:TPR repeat protein
VSPVKVNFQPEDWARPSTGNIETHLPHGHSIPVPILDRALPKTPDAPTPPPHTPQYEPEHGYSQHPVPDALGLRTASNGTEKPLPHQAASVLSSDFDELSMSDQPGRKAENRNSGESDATGSTSRQQTSAESSATTSASSVSGVLDVSDNPDNSADASTESSVIDDPALRPEPVPQLQYHHSAFFPRPASMAVAQDPRAQSNPNLAEAAAGINRHLTPTTNYNRRSSLPRPQSAYSAFSDYGPRGRSPAFLGGSQVRAPSAHSRKSPETRPSSFADLLNVPYPQPAPAPITFDNSQLRSAVGNNASLLSTEKTLEMYRQNVKKTNDFSILYSFAVFLIATAQEQGVDPQDSKRTKSPKPASGEGSQASAHDLVREARAILQKLSNNGYPFAQYYLADGYASGLFSKGKEDYNSAFPLFVLAAKHGHAESAYRTALCYEFGWGCRKDPAKAVQFLRTAASKRHPGAMTRLGKACLSGDLGEKRYREGIKWLKLAAEAADTIYNAAPYHLGCLYETGYGDDIFLDESYAAELFTQAADLGHPEANYRMGDAYEHGKLNCPRDPALSVHFYTGAAERGHAAAMMGLCAWYMVGAEPVLDKDEEEAYEWARRSAELGKSFPSQHNITP